MASLPRVRRPTVRRRSRGRSVAELGISGALALDVREAIPAHAGWARARSSAWRWRAGSSSWSAVRPGRAAGARQRPRRSVKRRRLDVRGARARGRGRRHRRRGRQPAADAVPMPESWRCLLVLPAGAEGLSGNAEERFFDELRRSPPAEPPVARLLLTSLLPGLQTRRDRGVRRGAVRDPAPDRRDLRRPAGRRLSSERGAGDRGARVARRRRGRSELVGADGVRDRLRPRAGRGTCAADCANWWARGVG